MSYSRSKVILPALLLVVVVVFARAPLASAHVLKQDNGISAVLHIPPEDNPTAQNPTELDLAFGDDNNKFTLQDCDCMITVKEAGTVIDSQKPTPALAGATIDSKNTVTFPKADVYDVIVSGKSKNSTFNTFSLDYLVRVVAPAGTAGASSNSGSSVLLLGSGGIIILGMIGYTFISAGDRYDPPPAKSKQRLSKS